MAATYSPYQVAGTKASLLDLLQEGEQKQTQQTTATRQQMGKMREEFEKALELAQARARDKAKDRSGLYKGLNLLGMFLGPAGSAMMGGISAAGQASEQKQALKLLKNVDQERWGKTFLRKPMQEYMQEAEGMQMSSGDVLRAGGTAGLTSFALSKMLNPGSKGFVRGGLGEKMVSAKKLASNEIVKGAVTKGPEGALQMAEGFPEEMLKGVSPEAIISDNPAFKQLMESFKGLGTGGLGSATGELKSAIMLPLLLQQMMGGQY